MILTCTPNPSVDHTLEVPELKQGGILNVRSSTTEAGGKGVNVSRALRRHGVPTTAVFPAGGTPGTELSALLGDLPHLPVPISAATRTNVAVTEEEGTTTKFNSVGPELTPHEVDRLLATLETQLSHGPRWLVASGSLPGGTPADLYAKIAKLADAHGVPVALDTSGKPLAVSTAAGAFALLKPNRDELGTLMGKELTTIGDVVAAARTVVRMGNRSVLVTLGPHGAVLVDQEASWWAQGPPATPRSTVGAGDCALAGYLSTPGPPALRLRRAVVWGAAAVTLPGTTVPGPKDVCFDHTQVVTDPPTDWRVADL